MAAQLLVSDLIAQADLLESTGRQQEAISFLSLVNEAHVSPEVEVRLVQLRNAAFDHLDRVHGVETWPPVAPDPFPGVSGQPPEIEAGALQPDVLTGAIYHHGSLIVRNLVDPAGVELLRDAVNQAFDARDAAAREEPADDDFGWYVPFEAGAEHKLFGSKRFVRIVDSPRALFVLLQTYDKVGVLDLLTTFLGERPAISAHKCALRRLTAEPGEASSDYHQDGSFLGDDIRACNVWLALSDCGGDADAPGLDVIPRRIDRILDTGVDGAHLDWTISESVVARAAGEHTVVRPEFRAGDAMFFDELMVHRTGFSDGMVRERMAIETWFFAPSAYPPDHVPLLV